MKEAAVQEVAEMITATLAIAAPDLDVTGTMNTPCGLGPRNVSHHPNGPTDPARDGWFVVKDPGFIGLVGPIWQRPEGDMMAFAFLAEPKHHNRRGVVQGGMTATFLDRAIGLNVYQINACRPQATLQLGIHYLDAIQIGSFVEARVTIDQRTRTLTFASAVATVESHPVAIARGVWKILNEA